jgi:hypothetical protein
MKKYSGLIPGTVGAAVVLFYLCFHSTFYNFDGVACAIAVELGDFKHLTHGNHLAYGLAGWAWTGLWRLMGFKGQALLCLQTLDSILGGLGAGYFCRFLLRRLKSSPGVAVGASVGLALSYAWWFWSLEAQVYVLGALFLILAADAAWAEEPDPWLTGFYNGAAVLGHVGNAMFLFCALYLLRRPGRTRRLWLRYGAALALTVLVSYTAVALLCVRPRSLEDCRVWLLGSAALSLDRSFIWFSAGTTRQSIIDWLAMTLRIFAEPASLSRPWSALGWLLCGAPLAAAAAGLWRWTRDAKAALLWLAGYALLFRSWQPFTMVYRVTDLAALWLLIALWADATPRRSRALAGWVLALGLFNGAFLILPQTDAARNAEYQEALQAARDTPEPAWVVVNARDQVYIPYFAGRKPLLLRYYHGRPEALAQRLQELFSLDSPVFITGTTLREADWTTFFQNYDLQEIGGPGGRIYRIGMKGNPSGSRQKKLNTAPAARNGPKGTGSPMRSSPRSTRPTP